jgi:hypothetical protein
VSTANGGHRLGRCKGCGVDAVELGMRIESLQLVSLFSHFLYSTLRHLSAVFTTFPLSVYNLSVLYFTYLPKRTICGMGSLRISYRQTITRTCFWTSTTTWTPIRLFIFGRRYLIDLGENRFDLFPRWSVIDFLSI